MIKLGILNYTTQIKVEKTIGEIESILASHGANKILKEYDGSGNIEAISFVINTKHGHMPVKLPMNVRAVMQVINNQTEEFTGPTYKRRRVVPVRMKNDFDQARRVGWRIIKDWLEAQLALISLDMVKIEEIFLPYIIGIDGKTLYEKINDQGFKGFLIEDQREVRE